MADNSTTTIVGTFATREAADIAVEHLVQEHGINRADVFVEAADSENTSGSRESGGDASTNPKEGSALEPSIGGEIKVSADVDESKVEAVKKSFNEAKATSVSAH